MRYMHVKHSRHATKFSWWNVWVKLFIMETNTLHIQNFKRSYNSSIVLYCLLYNPTCCISRGHFSEAKVFFFSIYFVYVNCICQPQEICLFIFLISKYIVSARRAVELLLSDHHHKKSCRLSAVNNLLRL